ncbi:MAG: hypothetical protein N2517_04345 [Ignavibacteria bacterium]|nr:hypothetical protein [Ignavibacteria bacterium]
MKRKIILLFLFSTLSCYSQESFWSDNLKSVFGELGWTKIKLSAALGFRFWNLGVSMGLAGFANPSPKYIYPDFNQFPMPKQGEYEEFTFTYILVTTDFYYFYEIFDDFIIVPSLGFYVQQDSILARSTRQNDPAGFGALYYLGKTVNKTGINIGIGLDYYFLDNYFAGIGFNLRRGIYLRFAYYWF